MALARNTSREVLYIQSILDYSKLIAPCAFVFS